jgi:hypothetical protein
MDRTTIQVSERLADRLWDEKQRGDSYEDVIWRLLGEEDSADPSSTPQPPESRPEDAPADSVSDGAAVDLPAGLPESVNREAARCVIARALQLLDDDGAMERSELVEHMDPEKHSLGYESMGVKGSWWRRVVKPGLEANGAGYENGRGWVFDRES